MYHETIHPHLYELVMIFSNKGNEKILTYMRMSKEAIKKLYNDYPDSFLAQGVTYMAELEEYTYCQAFKELLIERQDSTTLNQSSF